MNLSIMAVMIICTGILFIFLPMDIAKTFVRLGIARQGEEKRWATIIFITTIITLCAIAIYCGAPLLQSLMIMIIALGILGSLFFLFLPKVCTEKVLHRHHPDYDRIAEKIKEFQPVSREEFEIWRNRSSIPKSILSTHEDYMKIVNQTPEEKEMSDVIYQTLKKFSKGKGCSFGD